MFQRRPCETFSWETFCVKTSRHLLETFFWSQGRLPLFQSTNQSRPSYIKHSFSFDRKFLLWFYSIGGKTKENMERHKFFWNTQQSLRYCLPSTKVYILFLNVYLFLVYKASALQCWMGKSHKQFIFLFCHF